jgi:hypothetical protein
MTRVRLPLIFFESIADHLSGKFFHVLMLVTILDSYIIFNKACARSQIPQSCEEWDSHVGHPN